MIPFVLVTLLTLCTAFVFRCIYLFVVALLFLVEWSSTLKDSSRYDRPFHAKGESHDGWHLSFRTEERPDR